MNMNDVNPYDELTVTEMEAAPLIFKAWRASQEGDYKAAYEYQRLVAAIYEAAWRDALAHLPPPTPPTATAQAA